MSNFLDVRLSPVGGSLATSVAIMQGTGLANYQSLAADRLAQAIAGRHVLLGTHGFNVNRADGIDTLTNWETLLSLPDPSAFVGILWPGDSVWAHGLDYPEEPRIANEAGALLGPFIDNAFAGAASLSFASHSLGARLVLATISHMTAPVRRVVLMAGAIDDNCLVGSEFQTTAAKIGQISVLASKNDEVLSAAFPIGNFFAGIIAEGHPWWRAALGHCGPTKKRPANFAPPYQIPALWNYGHGNYLGVWSPLHPKIAPSTDVLPEGTPPPAGAGWQEAWSASFASTRFR